MPRSSADRDRNPFSLALCDAFQPPRVVPLGKRRSLAEVAITHGGLLPPRVLFTFDHRYRVCFHGAAHGLLFGQQLSADRILIAQIVDHQNQSGVAFAETEGMPAMAARACCSHNARKAGSVAYQSMLATLEASISDGIYRSFQGP